MILRSFPFCICFTCFKWKDLDSASSPRSCKKCLGRDLLGSRAPPVLSLPLSLFQNQCLRGRLQLSRKYTPASQAQKWVIMSHRNKMNKQQTTSYLQKVLSCTRSSSHPCLMYVRQTHDKHRGVLRARCPRPGRSSIREPGQGEGLKNSGSMMIVPVYRCLY